MEPIESEGKTVKDAIDSALKQSGLRRDQVEVQILQEPSSGFIGFGAKPAKVRITEKRWGPESPRPPEPKAKVPAPAPARRPRPEPAPRAEARPARTPAANGAHEPAGPQALTPAQQRAAVDEASTLLKDLLRLMTFQEPSPAVAWDPVQERVKAVIGGPDAERLISSEGRGLESLQFLTTLMVTRKLGASVAVQVEALGYWEKKEKEILDVAQRGIQEVKHTGKPFRLAPMDATMRRLVHRNLAGNPDVETASEGEGTWRKIVLRPRRR